MDRTGAIEAYAEAIAAAEQVRARFRSEEFKTGFFGDIQRIFDDAIELLVEHGRRDAAFEASERHPFFWAPFILVGDWR